MTKHNITQAIAVDVAGAPAAAGTTAVNGVVVDTLGNESIAFLVHFGAITATAVTTVKVQTGDMADGSDMADVVGSAVTVPDTASNKVVMSAELHRPRKRYARYVVTRVTANSVVNGGLALFGRTGYTPPAIRANCANAATPPICVGA